MGKGLLEIFPLLNRIIMVDSIPFESWLEQEGCCLCGGEGRLGRG